MNKIPLLEKFAAQSLVYVDTGLSDGKELIFSKEKFAELIVRECADIINHRANTSADWLDSIKANKFVKAEQRECAKLIKQHFGVEE